MKLVWLLAGLLLGPMVALAANPIPASQGVQDYPPNTTFSGSIVVPGGISVSLLASGGGGTVTMDPNSGALPGPTGFGRLLIIPPASGTINVCWLGGVCSASVGEAMGNGTNVGTDTMNLTGNAAAPTLFSTAGATVYFRN